jgi:hypothetical protein
VPSSLFPTGEAYSHCLVSKAAICYVVGLLLLPVLAPTVFEDRQLRVVDAFLYAVPVRGRPERVESCLSLNELAAPKQVASTLIVEVPRHTCDPAITTRIKNGRFVLFGDARVIGFAVRYQKSPQYFVGRQNQTVSSLL